MCPCGISGRIPRRPVERRQDHTPDGVLPLGGQWRSYVGEHAFVAVDSEAAISGGSAGYMQILLGAGLSYPLSARAEASLEIDAGAGGGGAWPVAAAA